MVLIERPAGWRRQPAGRVGGPISPVHVFELNMWATIFSDPRDPRHPRDPRSHRSALKIILGEPVGDYFLFITMTLFMA
jgi:hypothetical protein